MRNKFELTFWGDVRRRYRRWHATYEAAVDEAGRVHEQMDEAADPLDEQRAAHPAVIYGPGCGRDGRTVL
jgi:hypothetical protein